jgi:hypothetical protein
MKKIGILTFSQANNFGAVLQAYALAQTLRSLGHQANVLNYRHNDLEALKRRLSYIKHLLLTPRRFYVEQKFKSFRKKYLKLETKIYKDAIAALEKNYDLFITGSDQVWNTDITTYDQTYLLDFVKDKNKKFSYAASFGKECLTQKEAELYKPLLSDFKALSVRERQGADIIKKLTGRDAAINLDPTFLLNKKQWEEIAILPKEDNYVLMYLFYQPAETISFAQKLSAKKGLKLIGIRKGIKEHYALPTPREFIGYFLKAKYVITNSFHGTAFSINFNKEFFIDLLPPPSKVNSRLEHILKLTGLESRLISNIQANGETITDWTNVNKILDCEREKSLNYLKEITK